VGLGGQLRADMHKLTALRVKNAKPGDRMSDGGGLRLDVDRNGNGSWCFRYTSPATGRERFMGLGPLRTLPTVNSARRSSGWRPSSAPWTGARRPARTQPRYFMHSHCGMCDGGLAMKRGLTQTQAAELLRVASIIAPASRDGFLPAPNNGRIILFLSCFEPRASGSRPTCKAKLDGYPVPPDPRLS